MRRTHRRAQRRLSCRCAFVLSAAAIFTGSAAPAAAREAAPRVIEPLQGFEPFLERTWVATVDAATGARDVARWEPILGGKAIRITHSVADGAYGGETIVVWDEASNQIQFFYFTNAGFWTRGQFAFEEQGTLVSREDVVGHDDGIEAVEARQDVLPDGRLRVRTRMLRAGTWEDRSEVVYREDASSTLVLPDRLSAPSSVHEPEDPVDAAPGRPARSSRRSASLSHCSRGSVLTAPPTRALRVENALEATLKRPL